MPRRFYLVLICILCYFNLPAQIKPFNIRVNNLTTDQGLLQNTVTCIVKDHDGFIWIGTALGLSRYDGYEFKNYPHDPNDSTSLSANFVSSILCDHKNNIWVGTTRNGVNLLNRKKDNFKRIIFKNNFNMNLIRCVFEDSKNRIWFGTLGAGLVQYHPKDGSYVQYIHNDKDTNSIFGDYVADIKEDSAGNIWISHINGALSEFNPKSKKFKRFIYDTSTYNNLYHPFRGRIMYRKGQIWICNYPDGLIKFNIAKKKFYVFPQNQNGTGLSNKDVTCITHYTGNYSWVTIDHGGLNLLDETKHKVYYYDPEPSQLFSLSNDQLLYIYKDGSDLFWVGSYKGGIDLFTTSHNNFVNYEENGTPTGLSSKSVLCIYQDSKKQIWVGTDGGGLDLLDPKKGVIKVCKKDHNKPGSLSSNIITSVCEDHTGSLWIGTFGGGLDKFNPKTNTVICYSPNSDKKHYLNSSTIADILEDSNHNLWISTVNKGLSVKWRDSSTFEAVDSLAGKSLNRISLTRLFEDSKKRIWIGYDDYGVAQYDPLSDNITFFNNKADDSTSLSSNSVACIYEDHEHRIWIGTENGLDLYSEKNKNFRRIDKIYNLHTSIFNSVLQDKKGFYWIGTTIGILKFDMKTGKTRVYDYSDYIQGNEFNPNSILKSADGRFYFGGVKGISAFYPGQIKENKNIPPIVITGFYINNKQITAQTPGTPLKQSITETKSIDLNYKQNFISFKYAALNYIHTEKDQYAYYLEPMQKDWNYVGNRRIATYTNLSPGNYIFHVKGSNHNQVWNEKGKSIYIHIIPPFWMTLWFKILVVIMSCSLLFFLYYARIKSIKAQKLLLEKLVKEQTEELRIQNIKLQDQASTLNDANTLLEEKQQQVEEQTEELKNQADNLEKTNQKLEELNKTKDKFFSIIAHDLRSPFSTIFGFSELLQQRKDLSPEKRNAFIDSIYVSSKKIYTLLENLLQWSRMQAKHLKFAPKEFLLILVINDVLELLQENAASKNISIEKRVEENLAVYADIDMINALLRNIISNSVKFTPAEGRICITANEDEENVVVSVSDNGKGIPDDIKPKLFRIDENISMKGTNDETGTGLGLVLCKEFVEKNGGRIWIESEVGKGTTIFFTLKKSKHL